MSLASVTDQRGAVLTEDGGYLIIPPFTSTVRNEQEEPKHLPVSPDVVLPLSAPLRRVIIQLAPAETAYTICQLGGNDIEVRRLLRGDGNWRAKTTKAERSLSSAEIWLRHRLRVIEGGDPALSSILDPQLRGAENTLSHYATIASDRFWRLYRTAVAPLDATIPARPPEAVKQQFYGNPQCPNVKTLRPKIASLLVRAERPAPALRRLTCSDQNPIIRRDHHIATMMKCFIAVTFGTGQRGVGKLASFNQVNPDTGFAWVTEKSNPAKGYGGARGVFHPLAVRRHLAAYEDYLDNLAATFARSAPAAATQLAALRACPGLTFFDVGKNGHLVELKQSDLCQAAKAYGWVYAANDGRRWLRSMLIGKVPSDALAAQFGHHLDGFDVWSNHSGLAPHRVAAALEAAIHQVMATIGLDEVPKSERAHAEPFSDPANVPLRTNMRFRAGQILASAIWNGAMIDQTQEQSLLQGFKEVVEDANIPSWIELELHERLNQQRWKIDAKTYTLLRVYSGPGFPAKAGPDRLLAEFLGSDNAVKQFRAAAIMRWRFRLPPLLFAKAIGALSNHSLRDERFEPGKRRPLSNYGERPRKESRRTCVALVQFLKGYWRGKEPLIWQRKKRAHAEMTASLDAKWFYKRMTPLEQSLARGLIDGLVSDRGYENTNGYAAYTQIERAERLWRHFVPLEPEEWEAQPIGQLSPEIILGAVATGTVGSEVAGDLIAVLKTLPPSADAAQTINSLGNHSENYSVNLVHPTEFKELIGTIPDGTDSWVAPALTLCYRTGLRFSELRAVSIARIIDDGAGPSMITLDHRQGQRLKTFHSRRNIPLDVMLDEEERAALHTLTGEPARTIFPEGLTTQNEIIIDRLYEATGTFTSVFPLRHSFATNALAALLWPDSENCCLACYIDPLLLQRRKMLRDKLCGTQSLGAIAPYALAVVMGHTSPARTLFSYAHHLEVMVAAHVAAIADAVPPSHSTPRPKRKRKARSRESQIWFGESLTALSAA